jgi:hypothetical protein
MTLPSAKREAIDRPDVNNIYSLIGVAVVYIQAVEHVIKLCTTFVLQGDDELTIEFFHKLDGHERKKTLGYFIGKIRERASLHPSFDGLLDSVLNDRNSLIHNQENIPGWQLDTLEDCRSKTIHRILSSQGNQSK